MQKMDEYITYLLPNNVLPIIQSFDYTYLLFTINIIFLINIYLKFEYLSNDVYEIERIFHKKSKNLKIQLESDHNFLSKLNEDIGKIEDKFEAYHDLIKSHVSSIADDIDSMKEINEGKRVAIYEDIETINNVERNRIENKFEEQYNLIKSIIEDNRKMSDAIYDNISSINDCHRVIDLLKKKMEADKAELLDIIESVGNKVEEVYSDLDAVKFSQ
jgi:predicted RND superfamily exporter protein